MNSQNKEQRVGGSNVKKSYFKNKVYLNKDKSTSLKI